VLTQLRVGEQAGRILMEVQLGLRAVVEDARLALLESGQTAYLGE